MGEADSMTKKDYIAIAAILNRVTKPPVLVYIIQDMADYMKQDNPRFDEDKFIAACYNVIT